MKRCASCKNEKALAEFRLRKGHGKVVTSLPHSWCKECQAEKQRAAQARYRLLHPGADAKRIAKTRANPVARQKERARNREIYALNMDAVRKKKREWQRANPETRKRYKAENPEVHMEIKARYRAALLQAMPPWVDRKEIRKIFKIAHLESKRRGEVLHVDHIVPLQGETVSGLHVPWNLQILTAFDNRSKRNRFNSDAVN